MPSSQRVLLSSSAAAAPPSEQKQSFEVDSDIVVILAALLCALICVVGLAFVARCTCFHRRRSENDPSPPPPAKGLKKKAIRSLSKISFESSAHSKMFLECPICLVGFEDGDEVRVLPGCGHCFHAGCVDTWLESRSSCPSCRRVLVVEKKVMEPVRCGKCGAREVMDGSSFLP